MKHRITIEFIKDFIKDFAPDTILISKEYTEEDAQLQFKCSCGEYFTKTWTTIQCRKSCKCRSCARKDGWVNIRREKTFQDDCKKIAKEHGLKVLSENIKSVKQKLLCENFNGYRGYISIENIRLNKDFSVFSIKFNKDNFLYNLNKLLENNGSKTKVLHFESKTPSCSTLLYCKCECGNDFIAQLGNLTTQNQWRCSVCSTAKSNLEYMAEKELERYCEFLEQYRFDDCRNPESNYPLPFDFYIPSKNMVIEVDGEQHNRASKFGNETDEQAKKNFKHRKKLDEIKTKYCLTHNIKLVRISYKEFKSEKYKDTIKNLFPLT